MSSKFCLWLGLLFFVGFGKAQADIPDSLQQWWLANKQKVTDKKAEPIAFDYLLQLAVAWQYNNTDSALYFAECALEVSTRHDNELGYAKATHRIAAVNYIKSNYDESMRNHVIALEIFRKLDDKEGIIFSLNGIGLVHLGQDDFEAAIAAHREGIRLGIQINDSVNITRLTFNLSISLDELGRYDEALDKLNETKQIAQKIGFWQIYRMALTRKGDVFRHRNQMDSALYYYNASLTENRFPSKWEEAFAHSGIANVYLQLGNLSLAEEHAKMSLALAEKVGAQWDKQRAITSLVEILEKKGEYKEALYYHKRLMQINDSIINENKLLEINVLQRKHFENEKNELIKSKELAENINRRNVLINVLLSILLISFVVFVIVVLRAYKIRAKLNLALNKKNEDIEKQNRIIKKQNEQLNRINQTKNQLFSIISHDLKGSIASVQQVLKLSQDKFISQEELKALLAPLYNNVSKTSIMMNNLLTWAKTQLEGSHAYMIKVDLVKEVNDLIPAFQLKAISKNLNFIHHTIDKASIYADINHLRIIVQNILGNALKFTPQHGTVVIRYTEDETYIYMHVEDSGLGMTKKEVEELLDPSHSITSKAGTDNEDGNGLGMILVNQFLVSNRGSLTINSEVGKGSEFIMGFLKYNN